MTHRTNYIVYFARIDDNIVYVGSGAEGREQHVISGRSHCAKLNEAFFLGKNIKVEIVHRFDNKHKALEFEKMCISSIKPAFNKIKYEASDAHLFEKNFLTTLADLCEPREAAFLREYLQLNKFNRSYTFSRMKSYYDVRGPMRTFRSQNSAGLVKRCKITSGGFLAVLFQPTKPCSRNFKLQIPESAMALSDVLEDKYWWYNTETKQFERFAELPSGIH